MSQITMSESMFERILTLAEQKNAVGLSLNQQQGIADAIRTIALLGDYIGAIKLHRAVYGLGLKESKNAVDSLVSPTERDSKRRSRAANLIGIHEFNKRQYGTCTSCDGCRED